MIKLTALETFGMVDFSQNTNQLLYVRLFVTLGAQIRRSKGRRQFVLRKLLVEARSAVRSTIMTQHSLRIQLRTALEAAQTSQMQQLLAQLHRIAPHLLTLLFTHSTRAGPQQKSRSWLHCHTFLVPTSSTEGLLATLLAHRHIVQHFRTPLALEAAT